MKCNQDGVSSVVMHYLKIKLYLNITGHDFFFFLLVLGVYQRSNNWNIEYLISATQHLGGKMYNLICTMLQKEQGFHPDVSEHAVWCVVMAGLSCLH